MQGHNEKYSYVPDFIFLLYDKKKAWSVRLVYSFFFITDYFPNFACRKGTNHKEIDIG